MEEPDEIFKRENLSAIKFPDLEDDISDENEISSKENDLNQQVNRIKEKERKKNINKKHTSPKKSPINIGKEENEIQSSKLNTFISPQTTPIGKNIEKMLDKLDKEDNMKLKPLHNINTASPSAIRKSITSGMVANLNSPSFQSPTAFSKLTMNTPVARIKRSTSLSDIDKILKITPSNQFTLWGYIKEELSGSYELIEEADKREEVYNFVQVPFYLEKLILFGVTLCFDAFLFIFTFYPLRLLYATLKLFLSIFSSRWKLTRAQIWDLQRGMIIFFVALCLSYIDTSRLYHYIRGQAILKLYVIYNVLEICDKLCCSIGLDIFDSLFWKTMENKSPRNVPTKLYLHPIVIFLMASIYTLFHSVVLFWLLVSLNVAINSHNNALLTLLISNQFVELKGAVFKKFEKENLFQIVCADIVERFQIVIFLTLITLQNFSDLDWNLSLYWVNHMFFSSMGIWVSECIVDWVKHAFITKFNHISPSIYTQFKSRLTNDIVQINKNNQRSFFDTQAISKKVGLIPLPLACLAIRLFIQLVDKIPTFLSEQIYTPLGIFSIFIGFLLLCGLKILIRSRLVARSLLEHRRTALKFDNEDMPDRFVMFKGKMAP